ncbi:MAG: lyase family protein [archaeon]
MSAEITLPRPRFPEGYKPRTEDLTAGRYGTLETVQIWGPDNTFEKSLQAQGQAALTLSRLYPDVVPPENAREIAEMASLAHINPDRIREIEAKKKHDVIAINTSLEEKISEGSRPHVNKFKTSADTTQPARALQLKASLQVIAESVENLRDIVLEKALNWVDVPHMDCTHLYDAVPTVAGRPLAFYAEMLQTGLQVIKYFYNNSIIGKWADVTGNHHSAVTAGVDGPRLQREYCKDLGIGFMTAPAQIPGLEFEADIIYSMARISETINNLAKYISWGRSDDVNVFVYKNPKKGKGSSGMPHKDIKGGNPISEEQFMSVRNFVAGQMSSALMNCEMPYARNLSASADMRIILEDVFKFLDHGIRSMAEVVFYLDVDQARCKERVLRSYGVVTSEQVLTVLTDSRMVEHPMGRSEAHDLLGQLATEAFNSKTQFADVLLRNLELTSRIDEPTLRKMTDPLQFIGESKTLVRDVYDMYHGAKTL